MREEGKEWEWEGKGEKEIGRGLPSAPQFQICHYTTDHSRSRAKL